MHFRRREPRDVRRLREDVEALELLDLTSDQFHRYYLLLLGWEAHYRATGQPAIAEHLEIETERLRRRYAPTLGQHGGITFPEAMEQCGGTVEAFRAVAVRHMPREE